MDHACNRQTSSNKLLLIKDVSSVHQFYDSENFSNYYLPHQSPLLLSCWCGEVTNRSINLCFLTFWQESSNLSCMRLMKWRYCCIFVSKIIHGSHFRSCLSWDFTRAKKIIHNDDKRKEWLYTIDVFIYFWITNFQIDSEVIFTSNFLWSGVVV